MPRKDRTFSSEDLNRFYVENLTSMEQYQHYLFVLDNPYVFFPRPKPPSTPPPAEPPPPNSSDYWKNLSSFCDYLVMFLTPATSIPGQVGAIARVALRAALLIKKLSDMMQK